MPRAEPPNSSDAIDALLQSGLDYYGRNQIEAAIGKWREVLRLDPNNEQALDFLQTAGFVSEKKDARVLPFTREPSTPRSDPPLARDEVASSRPRLSLAPDDTPAPSSYVTADGDLADPVLRRLLKEQRFEDALKHLYFLRSKNPRNESLSRSIQLLREKLAEVYADRLVNLDRVPRLASASETYAFSSEERQIACLVDGISSFGDILGASKLGRVPTLRILCQFQDAQLLTSSPSSLAPPRRLGTTRVARPPALRETSVQYHPPSQLVPPSATSIQPERSSQSVTSVRPAGSVSDSTRPDLFSTSPEAPTAQQPPASTSSAATISPARRADIEYEARFSQATHSYLLRDFDRAIQLFRQCEAERPLDPRPQHNLKAIQRRIGKS